MSTKGSICLTTLGEHWYRETAEIDGEPGNERFRVYIELESENIKYLEGDKESGLLIGIKGNSEIAELIRTIKQ